MPHIASRRVIALRHSPRLQDFLNQDGAEGFTVFDAVDGRRPSSFVNEHFDFETAERRWHYTMPSSHAACTLSHLSVIREFADAEGAPEDLLLIAEDDARFTSRARNVLARVEASARHIDLLILADGYGEGEDAMPLGPTGTSVAVSALAPWMWIKGKLFRYGTYSGIPQGAGLYLMSRNATRKYRAYVEAEGRPYWPADWFHFWALNSGIRPAFLMPGIATWEGESSLGHPTSLSLYEEKTAAQRSTPVRRLNFYARAMAIKIKRTIKATLYDARKGNVG